MLRIKNIPAFRVKECSRKNSPSLDPHFIGHEYHNKETGTDTFGFFDHINGRTNTIRNKLTTNLNMAQDTQAIFEFVQNAVDADATDFFMYYDSEQFIALNNGKCFSEDDILSILSIGASNKVATASDEEYIGRFGVGFKLIHRMVGAQSGVDELINNYAGPIMFSWNEPSQIHDLKNITGVEDLNLGSDQIEKASPWLFKFLLTCFPMLPDKIDREVKDLQYQSVNDSESALFSTNELTSFISFVNRFWESRGKDLENVDLSSGSLFYLKLGKGKRDKLDEDFSYYRSGLNYSLKFIETIGNKRGLKNIYFNDHEPISSENVNLKVDEPIVISSDTTDYKGVSGLLEEKDQGIDIIFRFAYEAYPKDKEGQIGLLKEEPNFFKYFPMGMENHKLNYILHCNAFQIETSRREFQKRDKLNEELLQLFTRHFKKRLMQYVDEGKGIYKDIFLSILFSDNPKESGKSLLDVQWIIDYLYQPLLAFAMQNVPTENGQYIDNDRVLIRNTKLPVDESLFDDDYYWFEYDNSSMVDQQICERANEVMKVPIWDVSKIIENLSSEAFNEWYTSLSNEEIKELKEELKDQLTGDLNKQFWKNIQLVDGIYELIKDCERDVPKKNFLLSFDRIILKPESITLQNKNLLTLLQIARQFENDDSFIEQFQDQCIVVSEDGNEYALKDIAQKDTISFEIDKEVFTISLSSVLPETYKQTSGVFAPIIESFKNLDLNVTKLLGIKDERNKSNLANHIEANFDSYSPIQFAFFLLYSLDQGSQKFKKDPDAEVAIGALDFLWENQLPFPLKYQNYFDGLKIESSVYPNNLAVEDEYLPNSVIEWINKDDSDSDSKLTYLSEAGLKTVDHPHIKLRKSLCNNSADSIHSEVISELKKQDLVNLFKYCLQEKPILTGPAKGIFAKLSTHASAAGLNSNQIPLPVIIDNENLSDTTIALKWSSDEDLNSATGYLLQKEYFNKSTDQQPCTINEIVEAFKTSKDYIIDGRFIDNVYVNNFKPLKPRYANDIGRGKNERLKIRSRFVDEWERETGYKLYFFQDTPPLCVEFNDHVLKQYDGKLFHLDEVNKTVFIGQIDNTDEESLYQIVFDLFDRFSGEDNDTKYLIDQLKETDPQKLRLDSSDEKYYKQQTKEAIVFSGDWLHNSLLWEKVRKEKIYYRKNKLRFGKALLNHRGELRLSDYEYDTIPGFIDAYDELEVTLLTDNNSQSILVELESTDDFSLNAIFTDKGALHNLREIYFENDDIRALVKLGEEDPWLKQLEHNLFVEGLINEDDQLKDRVTKQWSPEEVSFIFGPPGTGKTTKSVLLALHTLAKASKENLKARILLLAPTNKAADVFIEKALHFCKNPDLVKDLEIGLSKQEQSVLYDYLLTEEASKSLYRYGRTKSEVIPYLQVGRHIPRYEQSLVATTIHRYVPKGPVFDYPFIVGEGISRVILDEASMISLSHTLFSLLTLNLSNNTELTDFKLSPITIAGDPFQLKPVGMTPNPLEARSCRGWSTESIYTLLELNKFDLNETPVGNYAIDNLKTQYRSNTIIGELYSKYRYQGMLNHYYEELPSKLDEQFSDSIYYIQFDVHDFDKDEHPLTKLYHYRTYPTYHLYSAVLAIELAAHIAGKSEERVLLLSPYGIQARILEDIIEKDKIRFSNNQVSACTVHGSQGDEADHVILVQNPSNLSNSYSAHFNNKHLINVAISRAQKKLFILLPDPSLMDNANELHSNVLREEHPIDTYRINKFEEEYFGSPEYLKEQIGVRYYSDFIVEDLSEINEEGKKYQFYAGDSKVFSWFNSGINASSVKSSELNGNTNQ